MARTPPAKQPAKIKRLSQNATYGTWYWKPEKRIAAAFKAVALGKNADLARAEARRLNAQVDAWLKVERPAVAPRRIQPRTVGELVALWRKGPMQDRAPRTRVSYGYELTRLEREFGHEPAAMLTAVRVDDWADTLRRTSPRTLALVAARGRQVFAWAARKGYVPGEHNPFAKMRLAGGGKRRFVFSWDDVKHILAVARAEERASVAVALCLGFLTIQRITDVLVMTPAMIEHEASGLSLRFSQSKTGYKVDMALPDFLRVLPELTAALASGSASPALVISEADALPYNEKTAARVFARVLAKAIAVDPKKWKHLEGGQLRDGRRSGFVHAYLNRPRNVDVPDICAISGHSLEEGYAIIEHYLPRTRAMADRASKAMRVK